MLADELQVLASPAFYQLYALLRHAPIPLQAPCVSRFVALHSYSAHGPNELDLQKGEGIKVLGKYQDGWLKGLSLVTGRAGIFPSDYVIPVFRYISRAFLWVELIVDSMPFQSKSQEIAFALYPINLHTKYLYNFPSQRSHCVFTGWPGT